MAVVSAMGNTTDELIGLAHEISDEPGPARARHARLGRRAHLVRARRDGDHRPRPRGDVAHRLAGRHRHRRAAHEGEDHRGARAPHPRGARPRRDRPRRRLPGRLRRVAGRHDARPRRLGHDGRRARRRARRRRLRDLHGRRRRVHGRSARRPGRPQTRRRHPRGDARDGRLGRRGHGRALRRGRAQPQCEPARPLVVRATADGTWIARRTRRCSRRRSSRQSCTSARRPSTASAASSPRDSSQRSPRRRQRRHDRPDRARDRLLRAGRGHGRYAPHAGRARRRLEARRTTSARSP